MLKPKLTKTELNKWYKDDYVQIASHPVKTVGEWSLVKVTSPYVHKPPYYSRHDFYLTAFVLRNNRVIFSIDEFPDGALPNRCGVSWSAYNSKTDDWISVAGKYSLKTFLQKAYNQEIFSDKNCLTSTELWNRYKIPLSVLNKFGFVTNPTSRSTRLYQKSAFTDKQYGIWANNLKTARERGYKYNNKDRWE